MPFLPNCLSRSVIGRVWLPFSLASLFGVAAAQTKQSATPAAPPPATTAAPTPAVARSSAGDVASANQVLTYTFTLTSKGLNADGKANDFEEIATEQLSGDNARITYFEPTSVDAPADGPQQVVGKPMFYGHGSYYLVKRGAPQITIVAPSKKKYFEMVGSDAAEQPFGKLLHIELAEVAIAVQRVQPDTSIQEMQAHHWRITESYTQKVRVLLLSSTQKVQKVTDYYFVPELTDDINPFVHVGGIFLQAASDDYRTKMQAAIAQIERGVPVLSVARTTTTDSRGAGKSILVTNITNLSHEPAALDLFGIPAGYEKSNKEVIPAERPGLPADTTPAISAGQTSSAAN
jgi:hypothetical protein